MYMHLLGVYQQFRNEEGFQAKSLKINTERGPPLACESLSLIL